MEQHAFERPDGAEWAPLIAAAAQARRHAHAPYSRYEVGSALACDDGTIVAGCNVENASYGATICAERNAIAHAVATGRKTFRACVVLTQGEAPVAPCGLCRQVLAEFARDLPILLVEASSGRRALVRLADLFPMGFRPEDLGRG